MMLVFVATLAVPAFIQMVVEARHGEWPRAMQIFTQWPTRENLRAYDKSLEDSSVTARELRPWMRAAQFFALREPGERALIGRDGWLFYEPGVSFLTQRAQPNDSTPHDALAAVVHFRDQLELRGIHLVIMPVPNKESVYPEKLTRFAAPPGRIIGDETRAFFRQCEAAGVDVVDLFALYRAARSSSDALLYLQQDSHWSPAGMEIAAARVAERIRAAGVLSRGSVNYDSRAARVQRFGDLLRMSRSAVIEKHLAAESIDCDQIIRRDTGVLYADDPTSDVLVLGDSFLRIYQQDEPGSAGFVAHLALALGRPLASIINDGGASTLVRQELFRRPQLLARARVVLWEFVERDLRLGVEGWQIVPVPSNPAAAQTARPSE